MSTVLNVHALLHICYLNPLLPTLPTLQRKAHHPLTASPTYPQTPAFNFQPTCPKNIRLQPRWLCFETKTKTQKILDKQLARDEQYLAASVIPRLPPADVRARVYAQLAMDRLPPVRAVEGYRRGALRGVSHRLPWKRLPPVRVGLGELAAGAQLATERRLPWTSTHSTLPRRRVAVSAVCACHIVHARCMRSPIQALPLTKQCAPSLTLRLRLAKPKKGAARGRVQGRVQRRQHQHGRHAHAQRRQQRQRVGEDARRQQRRGGCVAHRRQGGGGPR